ncbi:MAG: ATP-dependent RNA helicase HrpA [Candidatus Nanopelagicales bacterium]
MRLAIPAELPIAAHASQIIDLIRDNQVIVVAGETGSGKTTQLPKLALAAGRGQHKMIGHTQPRRLAARALAARIAEECQVELGKEIGFAVRFTDQTARETKVKVMTDGILLAELRSDRNLAKYDTIIIDEAHERSLNIDFLLGYLNRLVPKRPDLRVIITSATIDVERFSAHFDGAPIVEVSGRTYPVEIRYQPVADIEADDVDPVCHAVGECLAEGHGDVLVFLNGQREILDVAAALRGQVRADVEVLPLYARLSAGDQQKVFAPGAHRRVVLATNVAETSITVPRIRYVVDPGTARISRFSRRLKVQRLPIEAISQASANQRAGRCGRVQDGVCIRLYSEQDYNSRPGFTDPEIHRTNLASVILSAADLRLGPIEAFPFLDPPDTRAIKDGIALLIELGALEPERGRGPRLTTMGRQLAKVPLDPRMARMVLAGAEAGVLKQVAIVAAGLTVADPRERPLEEQHKADAAHAKYVDKTSDFLTLLNLWDHLHELRAGSSGSAFRRQVRAEYLNFVRVREWQDLVGQIKEIAGSLGLRWAGSPDEDGLHRALLPGLLSHVGLYDDIRRDYLGARGARFVIFPGSGLARSHPSWLMSAELVETSRLFARMNAAVKPEWVEDAAAHLVSRSYSEPHWSARRGAAVALERVTLYGIPLVTERPVNFERIDLPAARELFIREALVAGEWRTHHRFWHANRSAVTRAEELQARSRQAGLVIDDDGLFAFYDARIPADVANVRTFDRWWKTERDKSLLALTDADLYPGGQNRPDEAAFPVRWSAGPDLELELKYQFAPGSDADGVTVDVPLGSLPGLDPAQVPGAAPGHKAELITALLRSLPKPLRKDLGPAPNWVPRIMDHPALAERDLLPAVARTVTAVTGVQIRADDWDLSRIPAHLLPRYRVLGTDGAVLGTDRDLAGLQREHAPDLAAGIADAAADLSVTGAVEWVFGDTPSQISRTVGGVVVTGYPALVDRGKAVDLVVLPDERQAAISHRHGVRRLLTLALPSLASRTYSALDLNTKVLVAHYQPDGAAGLIADCLAACVDVAVESSGPWPRSSAGYQALVNPVRLAVAARLPAVLAGAALVTERAWEAERELGKLTNPLLAPGAADTRALLARWAGPRFVSRHGVEFLPSLARYCQALVWRVDKLPEQPAADSAKLAEIADLDRQCAAVAGEWPLVEFRDAEPSWRELQVLLDEYRVNRYAQHIRTSRPTSPQRIARKLAELSR